VIEPEHDVAAPSVDWSKWRACPVCRAELGNPCRALSGRVEGGRPDGVATALPMPHAKRQPTRGRRQNEPRI